MAITSVNEMRELGNDYVNHALIARKRVLGYVNEDSRPGKSISKYPASVKLTPEVTMQHAREVPVDRLHPSVDTYWNIMFMTIKNTSEDENIAKNNKHHLDSLREMDLAKFRDDKNDSALHIIGLFDLSVKFRALLLGISWPGVDKNLPDSWRSGITEAACLMDKQTVTSALDIARLGLEAEEVRRLAKEDTIDRLAISKHLLRQLLKG